jgi:hypothetical protein
MNRTSRRERRDPAENPGTKMLYQCALDLNGSFLLGVPGFWRPSLLRFPPPPPPCGLTWSTSLPGSPVQPDARRCIHPSSGAGATPSRSCSTPPTHPRWPDRPAHPARKGPTGEPVEKLDRPADATRPPTGHRRPNTETITSKPDRWIRAQWSPLSRTTLNATPEYPQSTLRPRGLDQPFATRSTILKNVLRSSGSSHSRTSA